MQIHYHGRHALSTYLLTLQPVTDSSVYVSGFPWNEGYTRRNCQEFPKKFMRSFQTLETIRFFSGIPVPTRYPEFRKLG